MNASVEHYVAIAEGDVEGEVKIACTCGWTKALGSANQDNAELQKAREAARTEHLTEVGAL